MILKSSAKPRKRKAEIEKVRRDKEIEQDHMKRLLDVEAFVKSKQFKIEDVPNFIKQNEMLNQYLRDKGIVDEVGNLKI